MRASGRSTLLTTRITGSRLSSALRSTKRVCGSGPSDASTSSRTPSTIVSPRSTSPPKSACPGVSTMLSLTPLSSWIAVFLARIVIPFSRSRSIESMTRSFTSWFSRKEPACQRRASTSVVFPWSTWATIATLRMSERTAIAVGQGTGVYPLLGADRVRSGPPRVQDLYEMAAKLVGINHIALEVGDIDEALAWYGQFFSFDLRGRGGGMAFIDMGDQFVALAASSDAHRDAERHFGLVVDDKAAVRAALEEAGVAVTRAPNCSFRDPWGNQVQVVDYREIQFTKAPEVLRALGLSAEKTERALDELRAKGIDAASAY